MEIKTVDKSKLPENLRAKRDEIIWSLYIQQEYTARQIQMMFNLKHNSTVTRIISRKPRWWKSPWVKREQVERGE
jgi:hypothetical protein